MTMRLADLFIFAAWFALISGAYIPLDDSKDSSEEYDPFSKSLIDISDDVHFWLFRRNKRKTFEEIKPTSYSRSINYDLDTNKKTKIIIHGWLDSGNDTFSKMLTDAYLDHYDYNIIAVDWSTFSTKLYIISRISVHLVAPYVAKMLDHLVVDVGVDPADIHIIGHSLGAHIAGLAGSKMTSGNVARITGLDPALPLFFLGANYRLDASDADFVDVIHTSYIGYHKNIGHADFYVNGGGPTQPGCGVDIAVCPHDRAYMYYVESLTSERGFFAWPCESWRDFENGKCEYNYPAIMGEFADPRFEGVYYLKTAYSSPFALGLDWNN